MIIKSAMLYGIALILLPMAGCTPMRIDTRGVEPRPLGKEFLAYRPVVLSSEPSPPVLEEPTGTVVLRRLLEVALQRHPELAASGFAIRAAEARALQAGLLSNPEVSLEVENFAGTGETSGVQALETTLQLSQLVELGEKRVKRLRLASLERDLTAWDYEARRLAIFTAVTKAFVDVVAATERLALMEELVRLAQQVHTTVVERIKAGKVSPVEDTRAGVVVATAQLQVHQARHALDAARQRLAASWGSTTPGFTKVHGTLDTTIEPPPPFEHVAAFIAQHPDVARWMTELETRQAAVQVEESKGIPSMTVSGGVRYAHETTSMALVAGISLPLPFFDRNQGSILEARHRVAQADYERQASAVRTHAALVDAYQTLSTAYNDITILRNTILPATQQAFDATTEGYRQGKFAFLDIVDAQRTLFETRGNYLEALTTYHKAVADVEQLIGVGLGTLTSSPPPRP